MKTHSRASKKPSVTSNKPSKASDKELNKLILKVLNLLRDNPRLRIIDLSRILGVKPLKALEIINAANEFVKKYSFIPDYSRLGFKHSIIVISKNKEGLSEFLKNHPAVNFVGITLNNLVITQAFFRNLQEIESFKEAVNLITGSQPKIIPITQEIVRENAFFEPIE